MHEISVAAEILNILEINMEKHCFKKINKIIISIGEFTCINKDTLIFALEGLCNGTKLQSMQVIVKEIKAKAYCETCQEEFNISYTNKICTYCNTFSNNIISGHELELSTIEGE